MFKGDKADDLAVRLWFGRRLKMSAAVACALVAFGAGSTSVAKPARTAGEVVSAGQSTASAVAGGWGAGVEAALPANGTTAYIESVSCPSAGNCSAVGTYDESSGVSHGLLLTETAGSWSAGVEAALPANAASTSLVSLRSVSCASAGNCSAVGGYVDNLGQTEGLLLTETAGSWSAGVEAALPPNAASNQYAYVGSVSCPSAGNCSAAGGYRDSGSGDQGLLLTETAGSWSTGVEAALPTGAAPNPSAQVSSLSCPSAGNCSAVGSYGDSGGSVQGLLLSETAGHWATGVEAPLPAGAAMGQSAVISGVSCASAGNCTAVGLYDMYTVYATRWETRGKGVLLTETAGDWGSGVQASLPANAAAGPGAIAGYPAVSCASAGSCGAVGTYYDNNGSGDVQGLLLSETAGHWATGMEASPANSLAPQGAGGNSVSCTSPGTCVASTGWNLLTETEGRWAKGMTPSLPANASGGGQLFSVSCAPGRNCTAAGSYSDSLGRARGLLIDGSPPFVTRCVVPKLKAKTLKAARRAIRIHNCAMGKIKHARSRTIKAGRVISQKPKAGRRLPHGAKVSVVVSKGSR